MTKRQTILVVEDEAEIRNMLSIFLGVEDFHTVEAENGKEALRHLVGMKADLAVLDLGLPDMDGQDVLKAVRQFSNIPIIVLTARAEDKEVVRALDAGADDYVIKPFRAEILLARIKANLRQREERLSEDVAENGPISMDLLRHEVRIGGTVVAFTPKEFALLKFFVVNKGRMLTHKQILRDVWGPAHADDTQYLRVYIGQVRDKLDIVPGLERCITSESGIGYRMEILSATPVQDIAAE